VDDMLVAPSEIVKKFNISYQTLNNYTNLGLLIVKEKKGNVRFYKLREVKHRLERIKSLKNRGYTLRLIRSML
jgi:DNA-binding transcriptional MerR regulator